MGLSIIESDSVVDEEQRALLLRGSPGGPLPQPHRREQARPEVCRPLQRVRAAAPGSQLLHLAARSLRDGACEAARRAWLDSALSLPIRPRCV